MNRMTASGGRSPIGEEHFKVTAAWIASRQEPDGMIPWAFGGKMDPWDHIHAAMGLALAGYTEEARSAFRFSARTQESDGAWPAELRGREVVDPTRQTNHAAYIAAGVWYFHLAHADREFLEEMWPCVERAIDFVVRHQLPCGGFSWAVTAEGKFWDAPLLTGSSSIHGSLVCALRIARLLGYEKPEWLGARERLAFVLRHDVERFEDTDLPEEVGRFSMDWYYPVLGGAVRGVSGRERLLEVDTTEGFVEEGVGIRCVIDRPWYTVAETCELVLALDAVGLTSRARQMLSWVHPLRTEEGGYWTGVTHPDRELYPDGEQTPWTAATVLMAADAVEGASTTAAFFRSLAGEEFEVAEKREVAVAASAKPRDKELAATAAD